MSITGDTLNNYPLDQLSIDSFTSYLLSKGWKQVEYDNPRMMVFTLDDPGEHPYVVALPLHKQASDYVASLAEAVTRLADVEETTPQDILQKFESREQDSISLRLILPSNEFPSLEVASYLFQGLRDLVTYGACMEKDSRRHFGKPFKVGKDQTQHFQIAHTFQGSFGFTIASQLPEARQLAIWDNPPLQRRVLERITRGFVFANRAQQQHNAQEISNNFEQGFNANMCNAVVEMFRGMYDIQMFYSVSWAPRLPPAQDVAHIPPILVKKETAHYLGQAAAYLEQTSDKDLEKDRVLEGPVTNLSSERHNQRVVTIFTEEWGKVSFSANPDDYAVACKAHGEERMIGVIGKLTRQGKRKLILSNPHDFHLLTDDF